MQAASRRLLPLVFVVGALSACSSEDTSDDSSADTDTAADVGGADAGDAAADTGGADVAQPDASLPDASQPDAAQPDAADVGDPDVAADAGGELPDVGVDTGSDVASDVPVADTAPEPDAASDSGSGTASWAAVEEILFSRCAGCHYSEPAGLGLAGGAYERLVEVPSTQAPAMFRVTPGDPAASYLWRKVEGTHAEVGSGARMPQGGSLNADELAVIRSWIEGGAPAE